MVDEMIPVLWFTYLVDKTITDSINEKDKKDNPKKP
jgi:hypothetical protein